MEAVNAQEIIKRIEENECYLLGQVPISQEELNFIMKYATNVINLSNEYLHENEPNLLLSMALVHIAINDYQDGKYWKILKKRLNISDLTPQKQGLIGKIFIATIENYNLFELNQDDNALKRQKYVENIKAHAFVTNNYMEDYYEFLDDYYENNLSRDLSNDVEDYLQDLSNYMKSTLNSQNDTIIHETSIGKNPKTYKLLKSTREVIAQCDGDILYKLFYPSLKLIDDRFYDGIIPDINEDRFIEIFSRWVIKKEDSEKQQEYKMTYERKVHGHKPYIKMDYKNHKFKLIIPQRSYRRSDCDGGINVLVTVDDITKKIELDLYSHLGSYFSEEKQIILTDPFGEIKIEFETLNLETFVINNKGYAFFNEKYINTNRLEIGYNYLLIDEDKEVSFSNEKDCIDYYKYEDWNYYIIKVSEDTICYIDNKPISIIGEFSEEPIFESSITNFNIFNSQNEKMNIARRHPIISFVLNSEKMNGTVITVNSKNFSIINEKSIQIYDYPDNIAKKVVSVDLNELLASESQKYKIELNIPGETNKIICEYILFKKLNFIFDKPRYVNESEANFKIRNEGLKINITNDNIMLLEKNEKIQNDKYKVILNSEIREIIGEIYLNGEKFIIRVPIKMRLYGNSIENLCYGNKEYIWYKDVNDLLYIKLPGAKNLGIYYGKDMDNIIYGEEIEPELYRINISEFNSKISNSKLRYHYLNIKYEDNKIRSMQLYTILRLVDIQPYFEVEYIDGIIGYRVSTIKGDRNSKVYISIKENLTNKIVINHNLVEEGINFLPELEREKKYTIMPIIEETDEFGLSTNVITLPYRTCAFISYANNINKKSNVSESLLGARLEIEKVSYNNIDLEIDKKYKYYIDIKDIENDKYNGILSEIEYYQKFNNPNYLEFKAKRILGKVEIQIKEKYKGKIIFYLKNYSKIEDIWCNLFYVKDKNILIENDNKMLEVLNFNQVIELYDDKTKYVANIKNYKEKIK